MAKSYTNPAPYPSPGLPQAWWDATGGAWLEDNYRGALDSAVYATDSNYQFVIPSNKGGGKITWARGVWKSGVTFRYDGFMADLTAGQPGDTANYLLNAVNNANGTTTITCSSGVGANTQIQIYYSYRTGSRATKGDALGGWPMLHEAGLYKNYGTAEDGSNYLVASLYHAWVQTGDSKYKKLADRIINASLQWGVPQNQTLYFDIPFEAEQSGSGLYSYYGNGATFSWNTVPRPDGSAGGNCLNVQANCPASTYGYAGWGWWPSWPVTNQAPITGISFDVYGDGSGNIIQVSTNIDPNNGASGNVYYNFPLLSKDAGKWRTFNPTFNDFWKTGNICYDGDRAPSGGSRYLTLYGDDANGATYSISDYLEDNMGPEGFYRFYVKRWVYNIPSAAWGVGWVLGAIPVSTGTSNFKMSLYIDNTRSLRVYVKDANGIWHRHDITPLPGWQAVSIPWTAFDSGAIVHPISQIEIEDHGTGPGEVRFDDIRFDDVQTMSGAIVMNGLQFACQSYGIYNVYFDNVTIHQTPIDPYPSLPRWTYAWYPGNGWYGSGCWRGPSAPGYMWMSGWYLAGTINPATGASMHSLMLQFMQDAQNAYATQFPTATKGPFMPRYGRWSWEAVTNNVLNQWYFDGQEWYGYEYRALLSVAHYYYLTQNSTAKAILDNWMAWIDAKVVATSTGWGAPSAFNTDGTLSYGYTPIYAHAAIAAACIYKYWVDGDALALKWYRRLLDDLHNNFKYTSHGSVIGIFPTNLGSGYSTATVTLSGDGTGATAIAHIAGGMITHYEITNGGSGYTHVTAAVTGDGSGATGNAYLIDDIYGAYSKEHTGWEIAEIGNTLGMLINGRPGGAVNHPLSATANDIQDFNDICNFLTRTARDARPSMMTSDLIPIHDYTWSSWHWGANIENPLVKDTHADGASWTEDLGPMLMFAVEKWKAKGDSTLLDALYQLACQVCGLMPNSAAYDAINKLPVKTPSAIVKIETSALQYEVGGADAISQPWSNNGGYSNVDWMAVPGSVQLSSSPIPQEKNLQWNGWYALTTFNNGVPVTDQAWQSFKINTGSLTGRVLMSVQGQFTAYNYGGGSFNVYCEIWSAGKGAKIGNTVGPVALPASGNVSPYAYPGPSSGTVLTFDFSGQNIILSDNTEYWLKFYLGPADTTNAMILIAYRNSDVYPKGQFDCTGTPPSNVIEDYPHGPGTNLGDLYFNTVVAGAYNVTSGWIETQTMDTGQTPSGPGQWIISDSMPANTAISYQAWGSDTGAFAGEETSLGSIRDGNAITVLKRYYRVKASLSTANQAYTPSIQSIKAFFPSFDFYSDNSSLGYEPSLMGISSLMTNIDTFQPSSIGQLTINMALTPSLSNWLKTMYPRNKIVQVLIGWNAPGFTIDDCIQFFTGGVDDWSIDNRDTVSLKVKDFKKEWSVNIPSEWRSPADDITWTNQHPADVILDILRNRVGVRPSKIDIDSFNIVKSALPGWAVSRTITKNPVDAGKLVEELRILMSCYFIPQPDGRITIRRWNANDAAVDILTDDNTVDISYQGNAANTNGNSFINRYLHYYGWDGNGDNASNFSSLYAAVDTTSQSNWGEISTRATLDKWTPVVNQSQVAALATNIIARYANPPEVFTVSATRDKITAINVGDIVNLTTRRAPSTDMNGVVNERYQVVSRDLDFSSDIVKLKLMRV